MIRLPNDLETDWDGRVGAAAVSAATVVATGYLTARGLVDPGGVLPGGDATAARTLGAYTAVRNTVLVAALLAAVAGRRWAGLRGVLVLVAAVQLGDTVVGAVDRDLARTLGPAAFAALLVLAAGRLHPTRPPTVAVGEP